MKGKLLVFELLMFLVILNLAVPVLADDADPLDKLERGVTNIFTGWLEIPNGVQKASEVTNPFTALTWGLVKGTGDAITRTSSGAYDTSMFLVPDYDKPTLDKKRAF